MERPPMGLTLIKLLCTPGKSPFEPHNNTTRYIFPPDLTDKETEALSLSNLLTKSQVDMASEPGCVWLKRLHSFLYPSKWLFVHSMIPVFSIHLSTEYLSLARPGRGWFNNLQKSPRGSWGFSSIGSLFLEALQQEHISQISISNGLM